MSARVGNICCVMRIPCIGEREAQGSAGAVKIHVDLPLHYINDELCIQRVSAKMLF